MPSTSKDKGNNAEEIWEVIPGFDLLYDASNLGRVRTWATVGRKPKGRVIPTRAKKPRIVRQILDSSGRPRVKLRIRGVEKPYRVHRLVLLAFHGKPQPGYEACHKNDVREDNRLENLYWGTRSQNRHDAIRNGRHPVGSACKRAKLTEEAVREMRNLRKLGYTYLMLAKIYPVSDGQACKICTFQQWKHVSAE